MEWESPACRGPMGSGDSGFWRYHKAVQVMLGSLLHIFWCRHWAMCALRHLSGFYCILMFSSWPCHPQDVFPSPLIRLTSCSCFKDTNSVGSTSDRGLSHLPIYSPDICVPEARGLCLSWVAGAPKFPFLFSEHCVPFETRLKVIPSLGSWQGQTCAICFRYYLPRYFKGWCFYIPQGDTGHCGMEASDWDGTSEGNKLLQLNAAEAPCSFARTWWEANLLLICCK